MSTSVRTTPAIPPGDTHAHSDARRWAPRLIVLAAIVAGFALSGVAFAAWTLSGEGTGEADAATAIDLTVIGFELDAALYPGLTTDATLTVTNTNPFPVLITAVTFDDDVQVTGGTGCTALNSEVAFSDLSALELYLAPNATAIELTLVDVVTMGDGANTGCQAASFADGFTLQAQSTTPQP
jgi:hypothetical protein